MSKEIIVEISPDGETKISVKGVQGAACVEATKSLEEALGKVAKREETNEYHEKTTKALHTLNQS